MLNPVDSIQSALDLKIDSIQTSFNKQTDSLKQFYAEEKVKLEGLKGKYQSKLDSLNNLRLPTEKLTGKLDSLNDIKLPTEKYTAKIDSLNNELGQLQQKATAKIESLKNNVNEKVKSLNLPPEAQEKVSKLTASVDKLTLPSIDAEIAHKINLDKMNGIIPDLSGGLNPNIPTVNTPNVNANVPSVATPGLEVPGMDKLNSVTGKAGDIQQQLQGGITADKVGEKIEGEVASLDQVKAIQGQTMPDVMPAANGEDAKKQLMDLAKKEAVNHFAGKGAVLQQAMDKMSKYKEKYESVESIKDLPKRAPNPMKQKPFIERLVPAITLQFQNFQYFMLDVNASAGYRFTQRITAGLGWNQRWAYSTSGNEFHPEARIYGVRSFGEYEFKKGFGVRADIECMNAMVLQGAPPNEVSHREWVWSAFTGIKQEYPIAGLLRGNVQIMYNLFDPHHKSPYTDRLNVRMGFEFTLKKKSKK